MRIAIVNDVALAREALRRIIAGTGEHQVAWLAADGVQAVEMCRQDRPDLILMDLVMPVMDGAEATRLIMAHSPCAILVVTSTVSGHLNKVFQAMGYGALDAVTTPSFDGSGKLDGAALLLEKIQTVARLIGRPCPTRSATIMPEVPGTFTGSAHPLVLIGASTGGPQALVEILCELPADFPAGVVVAQHVDTDFVAGLATWLSDRTRLRVRLAKPGDRPQPGTILLAGTNDHLVLTGNGSVNYTPEPQNCPFRPSINVLFKSVVRWPMPGVAVLLTGMGKDGAEGLLALRQAGWHTIAQDEKTSVVYGMPKAAAELNAAVEVLPLCHIASAVIATISRLGRQ